jgi:CheY-like chemotaxis protein
MSETKHILLLEDEPETRAMMTAMVESGGYRVTAVETGNQAVTAAREDPPDLVVSDLNVPGLDGIKFIAMLRHINTFEAPIVVVSGLSKEREVQEALDAGADAFLPKPVTRDDLLAKIGILLGKKD